MPSIQSGLSQIAAKTNTAVRAAGRKVSHAAERLWQGTKKLVWLVSSNISPKSKERLNRASEKGAFATDIAVKLSEEGAAQNIDSKKLLKRASRRLEKHSDEFKAVLNKDPSLKGDDAKALFDKVLIELRQKHQDLRPKLPPKPATINVGGQKQLTPAQKDACSQIMSGMFGPDSLNDDLQAPSGNYRAFIDHTLAQSADITIHEAGISAMFKEINNAVLDLLPNHDSIDPQLLNFLKDGAIILDQEKFQSLLKANDVSSASLPGVKKQASVAVPESRHIGEAVKISHSAKNKAKLTRVCQDSYIDFNSTSLSGILTNLANSPVDFSSISNKDLIKLINLHVISEIRSHYAVMHINVDASDQGKLNNWIATGRHEELYTGDMREMLIDHIGIPQEELTKYMNGDEIFSDTWFAIATSEDD